MTFWDHLDELRSVLLRIVVVTVTLGIVAFCFKQQLFDLILAPGSPDFLTYTLLGRFSAVTGGAMEDFAPTLINTELARQFLIHVKMAFTVGFIFASPYVIYEIFRFITPALYSNEQRCFTRMVASGYLMFIVGVGVSYFLIFPLTYRFLASYQVDSSVMNMITLESYISTLVTLSLWMGVIFEMPVLAYLFARFGFLNDTFMRTYHKHAVVVILVAAAIITPTSDVFTLLLVALPMWLLYLVSIGIVARTVRHREARAAAEAALAETE